MDATALKHHLNKAFSFPNQYIEDIIFTITQKYIQNLCVATKIKINPNKSCTPINNTAYSLYAIKLSSYDVIVCALHDR